MQIGAQLYTVRMYTQNERDFAVTLQNIREIGYEEVQISAVGPFGPEKIRKMCDAADLRIVLTHTDPDRILNDTEAVIWEHDLLGCSYIGLGSMPPRYRTPEWLYRFAQDYQAPAQKIAAAGKRLMYHNHGFEFEKYGGKRMIETLLEAFPPQELGFTLDTYWVQAAGADPAQWVKRLADRIPCVHLKDMQVHQGNPVMAPVLEGNMNFAAILAAIDAAGKTKHLLVEQDECLESPFTCLEKSYKNLAALGYR